jgi:chemotaxis signal transduction protein
VVVVDTYAVVGLDRPFVDPDDGYLVFLNGTETPQPIGLLVEAIDGITRHHVESVSPPRTGGTAIDDRWFRATIVGDGSTAVPVFDSHQLIAAIHAGERTDMTRTIQQTDTEPTSDDRTPTDPPSGAYR